MAFGGSITLKEMGLYPRLSAHNRVVWHWEGGALADAMADLIDRPEKRAAMGQKARERFESQFTGQVFARNTEQIYYNILKGAK